MTQEKQTSIRILQSKPTKKTLGKSSIFLLGLLTGVIITSIFFLAFISLNPTKNSTTSQDETLTEEKQAEPTPDNASATHHDENAAVYKQHINEKDFNKIFKHENKPTEQKNPSGSPFEQILKPESKPTTPVLQKPAIITTKPVVNAVKPKVEPPTKPVVKVTKTAEEEISPEGSVKVSIDRKVVENNP